MLSELAPSALSPRAPLVRFEAVSKSFGGVPALENLSLDIFENEFFALLGPSGCGKTTLLRLLAGFEQPNAGRILFAGKDLRDVPPYRRPMNMMFQSYALFPHLTVAGNIAFGLKQESMPAAQIAARVEEMLALVRLEGYGKRKPHQLSGGQRQRVALARSLAKRPKLLLLDEPMAALDKKLRTETQFELTNLQAQLKTTFVIVTHDQEEAMTVSDRIAVLNRGRLMQVATPAEIYEQPNSRWVAAFIGDVNLIEGRVTASETGGTQIQGAAGERVRAASNTASSGQQVWVAVRPEKVQIALASAAAPSQSAENSVSGRVRDIGYLGNMLIYKVRLASGSDWKVSVANQTRLIELPIGEGDPVSLTWRPEACVILTS